MSAWRAYSTGTLLVVDRFVAPLDDFAPLHLPPGAGDAILLCEDNDGWHWTVATTRNVAAEARRNGDVLQPDGFAHPEWPSEWQHRLKVDDGVVKELTKRLQVKRAISVLNFRTPNRIAEDNAVDDDWDQLEAIDASQFDERWAQALERARERNVALQHHLQRR
jgi:hypothetical protein